MLARPERFFEDRFGLTSSVMERLLEETSFGAADAGLQQATLTVDAAYVDQQLQALSSDDDLSRFIL